MRLARRHVSKETLCDVTTKTCNESSPLLIHCGHRGTCVDDDDDISSTRLQINVPRLHARLKVFRISNEVSFPFHSGVEPENARIRSKILPSEENIYHERLRIELRSSIHFHHHHRDIPIIIDTSLSSSIHPYHHQYIPIIIDTSLPSSIHPYYHRDIPIIINTSLSSLIHPYHHRYIPTIIETSLSSSIHPYHH